MNSSDFSGNSWDIASQQCEKKHFDVVCFFMVLKNQWISRGIFTGM